MLGKKLSVKLVKLKVVLITQPKHEVWAEVGAAPNVYPMRVAVKNEKLVTSAVVAGPPVQVTSVNI